MNQREAFEKYVAKHNQYAQMFGQDEIITDINNPTQQQLEQLAARLGSDLSPESLTCDGEIRGAALQKKTAYLNAVKKELESRGVKVGYY